MSKRRLSRRVFVAQTVVSGLLIPSVASASPGAVYRSITEFGGAPGGADNTPAFNAALAASVRNLYIPAGAWYFNSRPNVIASALEISGEGMGETILVRNYAEPSLEQGFITIHALNVRISQLGLGVASGLSGGAGIKFFADNSAVCGFNVLEDVYISSFNGTGTWAYALLIDGTSRPNNPFGVRDINLRNCNLFSSSHAACKISSGVAVTMSGGGMFLGAGSTSRLMVTGSPTVNSYYVNVDVPIIGGLYLDNCQSVNVRAGVIEGDITNATSAQDVLVLGRCIGQVSPFWTRGRLIDPGRP